MRLRPPSMRAAVLAALIPAFMAGCTASTAATPPAASLAAPAAAAHGVPDFTRLAEQAGPAVVNISVTKEATAQAQALDKDDPMYEFFRRFNIPMPRQAPMRGIGSGFIVSADGYILTNAHVVDGVKEVQVKLTDRREFRAKVVGTDRKSDVALLKIEAANLPVVHVGDSKQVKVGQWVVAMGSPFGFENSVTAGIVSAKSRSLPGDGYVPFIQTDVAVNPGNSGGPLFDMQGNVVGINSQIYSRTGGFMGLSFAIPADVALDVQKQLKDKGRVARGRIGVVIQEVTRDLATSFGLDRARGALVNSVEKGSPAEKAGVEATDIILSFDGRAVESSSDLPRIVGGTRPGSQVPLEVWRKGQTRKLAVTVAELVEDRVAAAGKPRAAKPAVAQANRLGIVLAELSADQKKELKLDHGLVVTEVRPESRADVRKGDVLVTVVHKGQHTDLKSVDQFNKLLASLEKNAVITLQVRRGEMTAFVTVSGLTPDKG